MIEARRAVVRPRVRSTGCGELLPLEDELRQLLEAGNGGAIAIVGPQGSGKSTALEHLAAMVPGGGRVLYVDEPFCDIRGHAGLIPYLKSPWESWLVYTISTLELEKPRAPIVKITTLLRLAPWTSDELI